MNSEAKQIISSEINSILSDAKFSNGKANWKQLKTDAKRQQAASRVRKVFTQYFPDQVSNVNHHFAMLTKCPCMGSSVWKAVLSSWSIVCRKLSDNLKELNAQPSAQKTNRIR